MLPSRRKETLVILSLFALWRGILFLLAYLAPRFLVYKPSFPYASELAASGLPAWIYSWANFDGVHYLTIARQGYQGVGLIQAFFPVFPFLLKLGHELTGWHYIVIGLLVSNLATLASLFLINATLKVWQFAWKSRLVAMITFLALAGSLFQGAVYTEGLFIFWVWLVLYLVTTKRYFLASLVTLVASATRLVGVFLVLPIVMAYLGDNLKSKIQKAGFRPFFKAGILAFVGSLGLLAYMTYLSKNYGDPLYFLHVQHEFGAGREERLISYPQVVWRGLKILYTVRPIDLRHLTYLQEFFWGTVGLGLICLSFKLKQVPRYVLFVSLAFFFLPTLTGTFSSMTRYLVSAPALILGFLYLYQSHRRLFILSLAGIIGLLVINTVMFIQGYWVA